MQTTVKRPEVTEAYYTVKDVMVILGCKATKAQDVIRQLNDELEAKGYMRFRKGHVNRRYFDERFYLTSKEVEKKCAITENVRSVVPTSIRESSARA